jgi:hypothetical protein
METKEKADQQQQMEECLQLILGQYGSRYAAETKRLYLILIRPIIHE